MEKMKIVVTLKRSMSDVNGVSDQWIETKVFEIDVSVIDIYLWIKDRTHARSLEDITYDIQLNIAQ